MEPMMASIMLFAGNFAPRGWAFCEGQLLSIDQYQALFSLLGTTYGGDGRTNFKLPDLRGRVPIGPGTGPGLTPRVLGQKLGAETTTLTINELPSHNHLATFTQTSGNISGTGTVTGSGNLPVNNEDGNADDKNPSTGVLAFTDTENYTSEQPNSNYPKNIAVTGTATVTGSATVEGTVGVNNTGNQRPFNNIQPVKVVNFIIALQGIYPSRS